MNKTKTAVAALALATLFSLSTTPAAHSAPATDSANSPPGAFRKLLGVNPRVTIGSGTITAKDPSSLTVAGKDGRNYPVNVDANTHLRRRFWGKATFDEFQVGDVVNVIGRWTTAEKTTVQAKLIRNLSIQKHHGVFIGKISALTTTGFTMDTVHRGTQTVTIGASPKITDRQGNTIAISAIKVDHRVRVKGLWNKTSSQITEVTHVKDYSLP